MALRTMLCGASAALAALAAGAAPAAAFPPAVVYGLVLQGPTRPVCEVGIPCERPAPIVTLVFSHGGRDVGRATSGLAGAYRIHLPAGVYTVRTTRKFHGGLVSPPTVVVRAGQTRRVLFHLDTGIR